MENQSDDQPLKWIERIKDGLCMNGYFISDELLTEDMLKSIFTNIKEKSQKMKNLIDLDVSFENKDYLLRQSSANWKLIPKESRFYKMVTNLSNYNIPNNSPIPKKEKDDDFQAKRVPILDELKELRIINDKLTKSLNCKQGDINPAMIMTIINCNNILIKIIQENERIKKRIQKRQVNIENYKNNHSWLPEKEWEKLSLFEKIMKRWNFTDMHQCLVPWEEEKLSKEELNQFQEKKRKWRLARMKELENNPLQRKIFDEFCHARKIGHKIYRNLNRQYRDNYPNDTMKAGNVIIHKKN